MTFIEFQIEEDFMSLRYCLLTFLLVCMQVSGAEMLGDLPVDEVAGKTIEESVTDAKYLNQWVDRLPRRRARKSVS